MNPIIPLAALLVLFSFTSMANGSDASKRVESTQTFNGETRNRTATVMQVTKASSLSHHQASSIYVYDAWMRLMNDIDHDGYYSTFDVTVDIDREWGEQWVYVNLYLSEDGRHYDHYHQSSDVLIIGDSSLDTLTVETRLEGGYHPADYWLRVEVRDAYHGDVLAVYDGLDDDDLVYQPLESRDHEQNSYQSFPHSHIAVSHGGATGMVILCLIGLVAFWRRFFR